MHNVEIGPISTDRAHKYNTCSFFEQPAKELDFPDLFVLLRTMFIFEFMDQI